MPYEGRIHNVIREIEPLQKLNMFDQGISCIFKLQVQRVVPVVTQQVKTEQVEVPVQRYVKSEQIVPIRVQKVTPVQQTQRVAVQQVVPVQHIEYQTQNVQVPVQRLVKTEKVDQVRVQSVTPVPDVETHEINRVVPVQSYQVQKQKVAVPVRQYQQVPYQTTHHVPVTTHETQHVPIQTGAYYNAPLATYNTAYSGYNGYYPFASDYSGASYVSGASPLVSSGLYSGAAYAAPLASGFSSSSLIKDATPVSAVTPVNFSATPVVSTTAAPATY